MTAYRLCSSILSFHKFESKYAIRICFTLFDLFAKRPKTVDIIHAPCLNSRLVSERNIIVAMNQLLRLAYLFPTHWALHIAPFLSFDTSYYAQRVSCACGALCGVSPSLVETWSNYCCTWHCQCSYTQSGHDLQMGWKMRRAWACGNVAGVSAPVYLRTPES